jgi:hypothetical protein
MHHMLRANQFHKKKGKIMNDRFDQLAKSVSESVTRRQALKRFAGGLAGMALACFGLSSNAGQPCLQSGAFCQNGAGPAGNQCGKCCSKSHYCIHSEDVAQTCFCN